MSQNSTNSDTQEIDLTLISNKIKGFYDGMWVNYLLFGSLTIIGFYIQPGKISSIAKGVIAAPTVFFLTSNFITWAGNGGYQRGMSFSGLMQTYIDGIPFYNKDSGKMDWAEPVDLPTEEFASQYPVVVLFLDEMNSAAPSVQAAAYQLVLNKKVGTYTLPKGVGIVAAGNRMSDKGVTYRMPSPLANRFVHIELRVDFEDWQKWHLQIVLTQT